MLACGVEEPVAPNPHIYALDEATGQLEFGGCREDRLNRYSFVWLGSSFDAVRKYDLLLRRLLPVAEPVFRLAVCGVPPQAHGKPRQLIQERASELEAQRQGEGWDVRKRDSVTVAMARHRPHELAFDDLDLRRAAWRRLMLVAGPSLDAGVFLKEPLWPCTERFAYGGIMAPGLRFIAWLADETRTLVYPADDVLGRSALVCIGPSQLPIGELQRDGVLREVKAGDEASKIWSYSPNYVPAADVAGK